MAEEEKELAENGEEKEVIEGVSQDIIHICTNEESDNIAN